jgi:6-pyruvoyltetrahydropterin/6-carboxytetrahydropterin synthase
MPSPFMRSQKRDIFPAFPGDEMFELDIEREFSAAHCLDGYKGNCAHKHGHNWIVQAFVRSEKLDDLGIALDFKVLKKELDSILEELDHKDLNALPEFASENPTSERLAELIYKRLSRKISANGVKVSKVRVCESRSSGASYFES